MWVELIYPDGDRVLARRKDITSVSTEGGRTIVYFKPLERVLVVKETFDEMRDILVSDPVRDGLYELTVTDTLA